MMTSKQRYIKPYMGAVTATGGVVCLLAAYHLPVEKLDAGYVLLVLVTLVVSSRLTLKIPRLSSYITTADTFIFLTMLIYGGEAAVLLAAAEGFLSSVRVNRKWITNAFNAAAQACSTFFTVWVVRSLFGNLRDVPLSDYSADFIMALCVMALAQYFFNSGIIALLAACKIDKPVWQTWKRYYLWTSLTYFVGTSAAGIIAKLMGAVGFYAVVVTSPIIAIIFFTYQTYLKNIEASSKQAEQSERHVEELSKYINEINKGREERDRLFHLEQKARAAAESASRVKDEFLATLSHELRTPLTSILGWSQMLSSGRLNEKMNVEAIKVIERSAHTQKRLIDDLLDVSRIITGGLRLDVKETDLVSVVDAAIAVVRPAANAKNITLTVLDDLRSKLVHGDSARLQQVLWNLLSNAVKFTPDGGQVEVRLEQSGSQIKVAVRDTGEGIPAQFLPYVFDRFRQADSTTTRTYTGLGLGLAIVRHLVELHGGTVHAESPGEGLGTTLTVALPASSANTESEWPEHVFPDNMNAMTPCSPQLDGVRVLVVDDQADARRIITVILSDYGVEVREAASPREALEVLEEWKPDVLISDIGMPEEDGYSLIRKVRSLNREHGGDIPAAALTAYAGEKDCALALASGFQLHLTKPVDTRELIAAVANLSERATKATDK